MPRAKKKPDPKRYYILMGISLPRFVAETPDAVVLYNEENRYPMQGNVLVMAEDGEVLETVGISKLAQRVQDEWAKTVNEEDA